MSLKAEVGSSSSSDITANKNPEPRLNHVTTEKPSGVFSSDMVPAVVFKTIALESSALENLNIE